MKILFIIIGILILRMLITRGKKSVQKQTDLAKKMAEQARRNRQAELAGTVRSLRTNRTINRTTPDDVGMNAAYEMNAEYSEVEDTSAEYPQSASVSEDILTTSEHEPVSHFQRNTGLTDQDRRSEQREEQANYGEQKKRKSIITLSPTSYRQYIIAKEIFDKPKALRK